MKWRGKKNAIQVSAYLNITSIFKEKKKEKKKTRPEGYRYVVSSGQVLDNLESVQLIKSRS